MSFKVLRMGELIEEQRKRTPPLESQGSLTFKTHGEEEKPARDWKRVTSDAGWRLQRRDSDQPCQIGSWVKKMRTEIGQLDSAVWRWVSWHRFIHSLIHSKIFIEHLLCANHWGSEENKRRCPWPLKVESIPLQWQAMISCRDKLQNRLIKWVHVHICTHTWGTGESKRDTG